jgi:hypothetical protein
MKIEVLYVSDCPNHAVALRRVREALSLERVQANLSEVLVQDTEAARSLQFPGSPTIRVNGRDVEPSTERSFGLMCRLYSDGSGAPSHQSLRAAIERARQLET